jgi:hypothetical protein
MASHRTEKVPSGARRDTFDWFLYRHCLSPKVVRDISKKSQRDQTVLKRDTHRKKSARSSRKQSGNINTIIAEDSETSRIVSGGAGPICIDKSLSAF